MGARGWAAVALGALLVALAVIAAVRVPWSGPPAPRADQLAAMRDLPADVVARGKAFHAALRPGSYGALLLGALIALVLGFTPLGARIVEAVGRPFGGSWIAEAVLGGFVLVLLGELVTLPLAAWRETILRQYGLSTQTWGSWLVDLLKGYGVGAVIGAIALLGFFGIARLAPQWWWAWVAAGAAGLVVVLSFVFPVLIEPIFNKFEPMPEGPLRQNLLALAERDGVPVRDVLVADASRRTTALNAYVSGLGPTRRIVVYDTLLREAPAAEVEAVVAHELGHAKERDVVTGTLIGAVGVAAAVCAVYLIGSWTGLLRRAGVEAISEPRAVALLLALATLAGIVSAPVQSFISRRIEARADAHALALTDDPAAVELMERRLATTNLSDVDPPRLEYLMFASHPSVVERIAAARAYARGER
ncbi:MAG TPA: M48 family metallopeptidase [Micromonosporaceae bacterium]|nr:M48 family metallopeptidase [Micromonosporaceae bacterium]